MNLHQQLLAIKAKIDTPEKWVRVSLARDAQGESCFVFAPEACSFCMIGAVTMVVATDKERSTAVEGFFDGYEISARHDVTALIRDAILDVRGVGAEHDTSSLVTRITAFNDNSHRADDHAGVMLVLDRAAEMALALEEVAA